MTPEKQQKRHNDKVEKWRQALVEAGNILGEHVEGMQNIFIRNIVNLFRQKLSNEFPECRLPPSQNPVLRENPSSELEPPSNKVVLYTSEKRNVSVANRLVKSILRNGNVAFEERNCSKDPRFGRELENLVGKEEVKFPMVIVNGKDVYGVEEVLGLDGFKGFQVKQELKETLFLLPSAFPDGEI